MGLLIAAGAYRRSSPVLGLLVVEATESLASPVSWSHHFIWMVLLVAWLALAEDRPRYGEWYALGVAVLLWAAPYWWVPHGPAVAFAGRGWLIPLGDAYVLVFIVLLVGAAVRVCARRPRASAAHGGGGPWRRRRAPAPEPARRRRAVPGSQTRTSTWAPGSRRRRRDDSACGHPPAGDDHELLGVAGPELVAPALVGRPAQQAGGGAQRPAGQLRASGATENVATSALPGAARSRRAAQSAAAASRVRQSNSPSPTKSDGRAGIVPGRVEGGAEVVARAGRDRRSVVARRRDAERVEPAALVGLRGRAVDLEPAHAPPPKRRARPS